MKEEILKLSLEKIIEIAEGAGEKILSIYNAKEEWDIEHKADNSPVTRADFLAHEYICAQLAKLTPNLPVLSEESTGISYDQRKGWERYWLVDPLDGTKEFIQQNGEFTVNIALIENYKSVLGVVHAPVHEITYAAQLNKGAYKQSAKQTMPIKVQKVGKTLRIVASRRHSKEKLQDVLSQFTHYEVLNVGSSLKMCLIAEGKADLYLRLGPTSEWDTAAAHCVLREAGGEICNMQFKPLTYNQKESILNPEFIAYGDSQQSWEKILQSVT